MTPEQFLSTLRNRDVKIASEGDQLLVDAPKGELSEDDWTAIAQAKPAILAALANPPPAASDSIPVRRLWARLLGLLPISPRGVVIDLGTPIGDAQLDQEADQLRLLLLSQGDTVAEAIRALVACGVLVQDERGWVRLVGEPTT